MSLLTEKTFSNSNFGLQGNERHPPRNLPIMLSNQLFAADAHGGGANGITLELTQIPQKSSRDDDGHKGDVQSWFGRAKGKRTDAAFGLKLLNHHVLSYYFIASWTRRSRSSIYDNGSFSSLETHTKQLSWWKAPRKKGVFQTTSLFCLSSPPRYARITLNVPGCCLLRHPSTQRGSECVT